MSLITIATCYRTSVAAGLICTLEAAGFHVFAPGFHLASMTPQTSLAVGGIELRVPAAQAKDAAAFLAALETGDTEPLDDTALFAPDPSDTQPKPRTWVQNLRDILVWMLFGVSPPSDAIHLKQHPSA